MAWHTRLVSSPSSFGDALKRCRNLIENAGTLSKAGFYMLAVLHQLPTTQSWFFARKDLKIEGSIPEKAVDSLVMKAVLRCWRLFFVPSLTFPDILCK